MLLSRCCELRQTVVNWRPSCMLLSRCCELRQTVVNWRPSCMLLSCCCELLKTVEQISSPLAKVFNLSLEEGIVHSEWKEANLTPLFKKGSKKKPENYRPVSLTSVVCKLLETLIRDHMVEFLVKHKLINSFQHGFLKARSCLTNLMFFGRNYKVGR